ncbi:hypothetical protein FAJ35_02075 [Streptococcus suis]|uniref:Uncharacterized protein n=1 Tax=Streptococcus suis TaxID=1307 RepID=A0A4T2GXI4_STRSU|nr:hypothetical protein FAJ35_02075 [Streptococcus suis]
MISEKLSLIYKHFTCEYRFLIKRGGSYKSPTPTPFIVIWFIFYYFVNSLCRTLVQPASRCLVLKANQKTLVLYRRR